MGWSLGLAGDWLRGLGKREKEEEGCRYVCMLLGVDGGRISK